MLVEQRKSYTFYNRFREFVNANTKYALRIASEMPIFCFFFSFSHDEKEYLFSMATASGSGNMMDGC